MKEIFEKISESLEAKQPIAYCMVVETEGSTPREPGAKMLVLPDSKIIGTVGGGLVEARTIEEAKELMRNSATKLLEFQLDSEEYDSEGLVCGGRMKIFVDTLQTPTESELFLNLLKSLDAREPVAFATVVKSGSLWVGKSGFPKERATLPNLAKEGVKLLINANGEIIAGDFSSRVLEFEVSRESKKALEINQPSVLKYQDDAIEVYIEPMLPLPTLLIAGAGHVGQAVAQLGKMVDFEVAVVDDRADFASRQRFPDADKIIAGDMGQTLSEFPIDNSTYVVIVTRGHKNDEEALHSVINSDARYIGMIGSKRKIKVIYDNLKEKGVSQKQLSRVHAPIGLDINSQTVPEIAVSIVAQLIQVRNG